MTQTSSLFVVTQSYSKSILINASYQQVQDEYRKNDVDAKLEVATK